LKKSEKILLLEIARISRRLPSLRRMVMVVARLRMARSLLASGWPFERRHLLQMIVQEPGVVIRDCRISLAAGQRAALATHDRLVASWALAA